MSNPLDPIMEWNVVALDSMRVADRVLNKGLRDAVLPKHTFYGDPVDSSRRRIEAAKTQVADLVVLSLVATFERTLRDHLAGLSRLSPPASDEVDDGLRRQILADLEYWKMAEEVLPLFSGKVDGKTIGQVKQTIDYRNWVAHGRSSQRPPKSNVVPQFAYKTLTDFLTQAGLI